MLSLLLRIILGKGGAEMMAMLFATKVILGKLTYAEVPAKLKEKVREILVENGLEDLATETVV